MPSRAPRAGFTWSYELMKQKPQEGRARKWLSQQGPRQTAASMQTRPRFSLGWRPGPSEAHSCAGRKQFEKCMLGKAEAIDGVPKVLMSQGPKTPPPPSHPLDMIPIRGLANLGTRSTSPTKCPVVFTNQHCVKRHSYLETKPVFL